MVRSSVTSIPDGSAASAADDELARKLTIAVEAAQLGIWEWYLGTNEFVYSDRAKHIFGFRSDEVVTRERIVSVMHADDHKAAREQAERSLDPALKRREPYRYRIHRADTGELRWIQAFGEPIFETRAGAMEAVRFIGTLQDVTEEVLAKDALVQQEARLRLAIEASGIAVWEINLADQTVTHSPELNRLCGFPPDARPTLEEFRSRYAPGERERIERLGAEARARGDTKIETEIRHLWPDGTEKWLSLRAQLAPGEPGYGGRVIGVLVDITEQKKREEYQQLLLSEMKHRIKNSFAVTHSIVSQSLRGEEVDADARSRLLGRLSALAHAHDEVAAGAWESVSLIALLKRACLIFDGEAGRRVTIEGDDVTLSPKAALPFALMAHELLTNAVKYGSLSNDGGTLSIKVIREERIERPALMILWSEQGGPPASVPTHAGFGTRLIDRALSSDLGAEVIRDYGESGLTCRIVTPLDQIMP